MTTRQREWEELVYGWVSMQYTLCVAALGAPLSINYLDKAPVPLRDNRFTVGAIANIMSMYDDSKI